MQLRPCAVQVDQDGRQHFAADHVAGGDAHRALASLAWLDAARISALAAAALGVDVIVHAVNPPSYRDWCCR